MKKTLGLALLATAVVLVFRNKANAATPTPGATLPGGSPALPGSIPGAVPGGAPLPVAPSKLEQLTKDELQVFFPEAVAAYSPNAPLTVPDTLLKVGDVVKFVFTQGQVLQGTIQKVMQYDYMISSPSITRAVPVPFSSVIAIV